MQFSENQISKIGVCAGVSLFGAVLNFIAVCVAQSTVPSGLAYNPYGLEWFLMIFYFLVPTAIGFAVYYDKVQQYRIALVGAVSVSLAYIPSNMHQAVILANSKNSSYASASSTLAELGFSSARIESSILDRQAAAGGLAITALLIYIVPMFFQLAFIGSDEDSALNTLGSKETLKAGNEEVPVVVVTPGPAESAAAESSAFEATA